jgi:hypothetical protein
MQKIFNHKSYNCLVWTPLGSIVKRNIFAFKFTLRSQQPDIVPIICHRCHWHRWQICKFGRWYRWCSFTSEYLGAFSKKFETVLKGYSGAGGKLIHEKNQKQKISWHCPFKPPPPARPTHKRPYSNWFMFNCLMTTSPFILLLRCYFMSDMFARTKAVDPML